MKIEINCFFFKFNSQFTKAYNMFPLCQIYQHWLSMWCASMNNGPGRANSDQENADNCCRECSCMCLPLILVADILTCPCQVGMWCALKMSKPKPTEAPTL